jgi:hypothetical protein
MRLSRANVFNLNTIETIYPEKVWQQDAARNSAGKTSLLRGVLIRSNPDADGQFRMSRATRHVGEQKQKKGQNAVFLCPYMGGEYHRFAPAAGVHGAYRERPGVTVDVAGEYRQFLEQIVSTAREARLQD